MHREIIPRTSVGDIGGISSRVAEEVRASVKTEPESQSGLALAVLAIGIGGALYYMSMSKQHSGRGKAGFQVSSMDQKAQAKLWLDRVERQAYRHETEFKNLTPDQHNAIEEVRMCAEGAYKSFK